MNLIEIKPMDSPYQSLSLNLEIGKKTKRVNFELRYMEKTDLWYVTLTDLQTDESYLRFVPLLASSKTQLNNLWEPFRHKGIGMLGCIPVVDNPSSENPSLNNLNEFAIVWGDGIG